MVAITLDTNAKPPLRVRTRSVSGRAERRTEEIVCEALQSLSLDAISCGVRDELDDGGGRGETAVGGGKERRNAVSDNRRVRNGLEMESFDILCPFLAAELNPLPTPPPALVPPIILDGWSAATGLATLAAPAIGSPALILNALISANEIVTSTASFGLYVPLSNLLIISAGCAFRST